MTWPYLLAAERARRELSEAAQVRYADALIEIVAQPWLPPHIYGEWVCPHCRCGSREASAHFGGCPWLIAARALGVAHERVEGGK